MKSRFVQVYLRSAGLILAVTALGKAIPAHQRNLCIENPLLGPFQRQLELSNQTLLWIASAVEFSILLLICFSHRRWLPCLASGAWGAICLFVRLAFLGPDAATSCNCLGWFQQIIPLSQPVLNNILLTLATWLAFGGFVSFGFTSTNIKPREKEAIVAAAIVLSMIFAAFFWYFPLGFPDGPRGFLE
jgi:hypothetical protein